MKSLVLFFILEETFRHLILPAGIVPEWRYMGKKIDFPFGEKVREPKWIGLETTISSKKGELYLVLPRMGLTNITVFLNGREVLKLGDEDLHSRMWTYTFVAPLDLKDGENEVVVRSYVLYDYKINWPPYLSRNPWIAVFL